MKGQLSLSNLLLIFIALFGVSKQSSFEDERCVCACPPKKCLNGAGPVFVKNHSPNDCLCEKVVPRENCTESSKERDLCHYCSCRHETRNTTTIKVVVIFIICVMAMLIVYMLFLLCLDPLLNGRRLPTPYTPQIDEDVTMDNMTTGRRSRPAGESSQGGAAAVGVVSRPSSLLNRVTSEQQKWKGTVEEQRRNIYKFHSMLN